LQFLSSLHYHSPICIRVTNLVSGYAPVYTYLTYNPYSTPGRSSQITLWEPRSAVNAWHHLPSEASADYGSCDARPIASGSVNAVVCHEPQLGGREQRCAMPEVALAGSEQPMDESDVSLLAQQPFCFTM
jgi:hypothetical protein